MTDTTRRGARPTAPGELAAAGAPARRVAIVEKGGVPPAPRPAARGRAILYERLTGDEARRRAMSPEPSGAGMTREAAEGVEYLEVWTALKPSAGFDFRMYSFGGALVAARTTRSH